MKHQRTLKQTEHPPGAYAMIIVLVLVSVALLLWAFYDGEQYGLTADQRRIASLFAAVLAGGIGFFCPGVILKLIGEFSPRVRFTIRALGCSAMLIFGLLHPLFGYTSPEHGFGDVNHRIEITSPSAGAMVNETVEVRGRTELPRWYHFIVVSPVATGDDIVQASLVEVSPTGEISGNASIGGTEVGVDQAYVIRIVASKMALKAGPLGSRRGLVFSDAITVKRSVRDERS